MHTFAKHLVFHVFLFFWSQASDLLFTSLARKQPQTVAMHTVSSQGVPQIPFPLPTFILLHQAPRDLTEDIND